MSDRTLLNTGDLSKTVLKGILGQMKKTSEKSKILREEEIQTVNNQRTVKEIFVAVKYMRLTCIY